MLRARHYPPVVNCILQVDVPPIAFPNHAMPISSFPSNRFWFMTMLHRHRVFLPGPIPGNCREWIWTLIVLYWVLSRGSEAARASVAAKGSFILGSRSTRTRRVAFSLKVSEELTLLSAAVLDHYSDFVYHALLSNNGSNFSDSKLHECGSLQSINK